MAKWATKYKQQIKIDICDMWSSIIGTGRNCKNFLLTKKFLCNGIKYIFFNRNVYLMISFRLKLIKIISNTDYRQIHLTFVRAIICLLYNRLIC